MRQGWELMNHIAEQYAAILPQDLPDFEFRMSRPTWDKLCDMNNLHGRDPVFGDSCFGVPAKVWPGVPDGAVWRVSKELLKDLGETG